MHTISLGRLVKERSQSCSGPPLLTFVSLKDEGGYRIESRHYDTLWKRGQAIAQALVKRGHGTGDRIALLMQNHCEFVDVMVASSILGLVLVPIDPRTRGKKLLFMLSSVGCKGVITGSYCLDQLQEVLRETTSVGWTWLVGPRSERIDLPAGTSWLDDETADDLDAPMQLLFTSGTTGDPKAIVGSFRRYALMSSLVNEFGIGPSDRMYTGLSLTHSNASGLTLGGALYNGIPAVISQKFSKSSLWSIIRDFHCTTLNLLGGMFSAIHSEPVDDRDADNPLRLIIGSGMPRNLWDPFAQRFGVQILELYGAAEGGVMINHPGVGPIGSIGKPLPGLTAHILDEDDHECPPFQPGEIAFENADGRPISVTYLGNPTASAEKTRGGWLRMSDIGYRDDEGWFYFLHRNGSELRRNGDFISPGFLEKEIAEHPDVDDVFVYGVESDNGVPGEKDVVAAIVPRDAHAWDAQSIFAFCECRLERNTVPSFLQLVDEIPKTASEKPIERILRASFDSQAPNVFVHRGKLNPRPA
jgi:crotonobetaine/carnitine-CoA ligase